MEELKISVAREEPGVVIYNIGFSAPHPPIGPPPDYAVSGEMTEVPASEQTEVVFFEVYKDAEAFSAHLTGAFARFLAKNRHLFATPWQGHPRPEVLYLDPRHGFARQALLDAAAGAGE